MNIARKSSGMKNRVSEDVRMMRVSEEVRKNRAYGGRQKTSFLIKG